MKRTLLSLGCCIVFFLAALNVQAQLADYSIAPDFTGTDINGNEINLYSILDEGKSVIIDFSATWCPPCWSYHQTHVLNDVYDAYGPDGTDELMVIFVEGDPSTNMADLQGTGSNTQGNWIAGTNYPIIDDASIATMYQVPAWPTFYFICPNRILTQNPRFTTKEGHYERLQDLHCQKPEGENNAGIVNYTGFNEDLFCGILDFTPSIRFQNLGSSNLTSANIDVYNNGNLVGSTPWTGDIAQFGEVELALADFVSDVSTDMVIDISSVNGGMDDTPTNNQYQLAFAATDVVVEYEKLNLTLTTDTYGCETYWTLTNKDNGEVVASGGNPSATEGGQALGGSCAGAQAPAYGNNATINETILVPIDGCFEFKIIDDYGDGMCCTYGQGGYSLTDDAGNVLSSGGSFGPSSAVPFGVERLLSGDGAVQSICEGEEGMFAFDLGNNFGGTVEYLATGEGIVTFDQPAAAPGSTVTATITGLPVGTNTITVTASDGTKVATKDYTFEVTAIPAAAVLTQPANGAVMIETFPSFTWDAIPGISQYFFEVASDDQFTNVVKNAVAFTNSYTMTDQLNFGQAYFWRVSVSNDCGEAIADPFDFQTEGSTSVGELNGVSVDVRPNPTNGIVNVYFEQPTYSEVDVQVFSLDGKLLQNQRTAEQQLVRIDLSNYENGLYIIKLVDADKTLTSKVLLNK